MTDTTTQTNAPATTAAAAPYTPPPSVAAQIDAMVAARATDNPMPPLTVKSNVGGARYNSATGELTTWGEQPPQDAPVTGTNVVEQRASFNKIGTDLQRVVAKLDEHSFDPRTGEKVYTAQGDERRMLELQAVGYYRAGEAVQSTIIKLTQQDNSAAELAEQQNAERAARRAFSKGDPALDKIFSEELARAEAAQAVQLVIAGRKK